MLSIYEYSDAAQFLRDVWQEKKSRNSAFSERAWARSLGFKSNASLSLILHGRRGIPKSRIARISASIGLSSKESLYFEALAGVASSKSPEEREFYYARLQSLTPKTPLKRVEVEAYRYLGDPLHTHILEMTDLPNFDEDARWIQSRLRKSASLLEIREAVDRLVGLGLLQENESGKLKRTQSHVSTKQDFADKGVQKYHKNILALAADLLSQTPLSDREYGSYSLNIAKAKIPRAKELLREFVEKFIFEIEAPVQSGEETYQLSLQFFPVTQNKVPNSKGELK